MTLVEGLNNIIKSSTSKNGKVYQLPGAILKFQFSFYQVNDYQVQ